MLGSVLYGSADFCGGMSARRASALVVTFFSCIPALAILLVGLPLAGGITRGPDLVFGVLGGTFGGVGAMLLYRAMAIGPVSVASPIVSMAGLAVPLIGGLLLGERPGAVPIVGLVLVPVAVPLLASESPPRSGGPGPADPRDPHRAGRAVGPSLVAGVVVGFFLLFLGRIESGASLWALIAARTAGLLTLMAALFVRREPLLPPPEVRRLALGTGLLDSLANVTYVAAVQRGSMSLVAALVSLAPATTVLLAHALLGERWSLAQRAGLGLALIAGVCISAG